MHDMTILDLLQTWQFYAVSVAAYSLATAFVRIVKKSLRVVTPLWAGVFSCANLAFGLLCAIPPVLPSDTLTGRLTMGLMCGACSELIYNALVKRIKECS